MYKKDMTVRDIIKELNKLPQDMVITNCEPVCKIVEVEIKTIPTDNKPFLNDIGMMCDLISLSRDSFLAKYFYITSLQYDITSNLFYQNKRKNLEELYNRMLEIDTTKALIQTQLLKKEIEKLNRKK